MMYFTTKWGAKKPQNPQNHRVGVINPLKKETEQTGSGNKGCLDDPVGLSKFKCSSDMGVSKNNGTQKWMVYGPIKMDDLGVPLFLETPI